MPDVTMQTDRAPVGITPVPGLVRLLLRGDPAAIGAALGLQLPTSPCTAHPGEPAILWLGPDEWLLLAAEGFALTLWESAGGASYDVSHRQVGLLIEGEQAAELLAAACPFDVSSLPVDGCTRTVLGKAEVVIWRCGPASFHVEIWRSFAPYVRDLLAGSIPMLG